jgi:hypothetical protein
VRLPLLLVLLAITAGSATAAAAGDGRPKKEIKPAVQARARGITLRAADLPGSGWDTASSGFDLAALPHCPFYKPDESDLTENGSAGSPTFHRPDGSDATSSVVIFATAAQGRIAYRRIVKPALARCLGRFFALSGASLRSVSTLSLPRFGERSAAYRVSLLVPGHPKRVPVAMDLVLVNRARVDLAIAFTGLPRPYAPGFQQHVLRRVVGRI